MPSSCPHCCPTKDWVASSWMSISKSFPPCSGHSFEFYCSVLRTFVGRPSCPSKGSRHSGGERWTWTKEIRESECRICLWMLLEESLLDVIVKFTWYGNRTSFGARCSNRFSSRYGWAAKVRCWVWCVSDGRAAFHFVIGKLYVSMGPIVCVRSAPRATGRSLTDVVNGLFSSMGNHNTNTLCLYRCWCLRVQDKTHKLV